MSTCAADISIPRFVVGTHARSHVRSHACNTDLFGADGLPPRATTHSMTPCHIVYVHKHAHSRRVICHMWSTSFCCPNPFWVNILIIMHIIPIRRSYWVSRDRPTTENAPAHSGRRLDRRERQEFFSPLRSVWVHIKTFNK